MAPPVSDSAVAGARTGLPAPRLRGRGEPDPYDRTAVLPTLVLRSVRARFADVHGCESAALTRLRGRAARNMQGDVPRRRHEGPHNFDPFLGTATPRVIVSARQHVVKVGMRVRFTPRPACASSHLPLACNRFAAAWRREDDGYHRHHRGRHCGRPLGGMQTDSRRLGALLAAVAAAAGRCEAAWSCKAATKAAVAAQQRGGKHRVGQVRLSGVSDGFGGAVRLADCRHPSARGSQKSASNRAWHFSRLCVRLWLCASAMRDACFRRAELPSTRGYA
jgi:hypothetical protein